MSDFLWPHGLQHSRPPCPSPTPRAYSNSCPLSRWCPSTISPFFIPFFSRLQSFPASGSFQMSQLFTSGGQSTGVSASTSVLPMDTQDWSPVRWTGWISLQSKRLSSIFSNITADGDCSHEIKRRLLLGRKVMTNLDSILKSGDITLLTKVHLVKVTVFPVVMYGCKSWTIKQAEHRIDPFEP